MPSDSHYTFQFAHRSVVVNFFRHVSSRELVFSSFAFTPYPLFFLYFQRTKYSGFGYDPAAFFWKKGLSWSIYYNCEINYNYFVEEDKENELPQSQVVNVSNLISSKDTIHVLRLAAVLHIRTHYWLLLLKGENLTAPDLEIGEDSIKRANNLFNTVAQQKAVFLEVLIIH